MIDNEDWLRTVTWDVTNPDGTFVGTLGELADALQVDRATAAAKVLTLPFGKAAPPELLADAMSEVAK